MKEDFLPLHLCRTAPRYALLPLLAILSFFSGQGKGADIGFTIDPAVGRLAIASITASNSPANIGAEALNAIDNDLRTRWSAQGMSQWITVDLGIPQQIRMTRISFTSYQWQRSVEYALEASMDGVNWLTVANNAVSTPGIQWSEVTFSAVDARYVRITIKNADQPNVPAVLNSEINEIQVYGSHIPPVRLQVPAVTTSGYDTATGAVAEYVLDGNLRTYWSAPGLPQWVILDLGVTQLVSLARISFTAYHWGRTYGFTVATSLDGINWTEAITTDSIPAQWTEVSFTPINARYVRVTLNDTTSPVANAEINEIELFGVDSNTPPATLLTLSWSPDLTGNTLGYIIYYGPTAETANMEISNIPVNSTGFDPQAPLQQYDPYGELGLLPGDNVCFRLKAYNDSGLSQWSAPVCGGV